jgi:hypothetical protein
VFRDARGMFRVAHAMFRDARGMFRDAQGMFRDAQRAFCDDGPNDKYLAGGTAPQKVLAKAPVAATNAAGSSRWSSMTHPRRNNRHASRANEAARSFSIHHSAFSSRPSLWPGLNGGSPPSASVRRRPDAVSRSSSSSDRPARDRCGMRRGPLSLSAVHQCRYAHSYFCR